MEQDIVEIKGERIRLVKVNCLSHTLIHNLADDCGYTCTKCIHT
jgi:hypothetical protein